MPTSWHQFEKLTFESLAMRMTVRSTVCIVLLLYIYLER
jgi:hypothetical protein